MFNTGIEDPIELEEVWIARNAQGELFHPFRVFHAEDGDHLPKLDEGLTWVRFCECPL